MSIDRDIMNVAQAAEFAGVAEADILQWIDRRGLKATPIGTIGRRGPRRYLIRRQWLIDNIEAHAESRSAPAAAGDTPKAPARPVRRRVASPADPLGPKPTTKAP